MMEERKVPALRFQGFTDGWEEKAIGELSEKNYGGGTPRTSEELFWDGDIPWFQSADLIENEVLTARPKKKITSYGLYNSAAQLIPKNSIAIVTRVGVGKLAFIPFPYTTSQDFLSLSQLKIDDKFGCYVLYRALQRNKAKTQGTSIKGITKEEILREKVLLPSQEEQIKIGSFFSVVDSLINFQNSRLDKLQAFKKSMLENMFPRPGEKVPKVRFRGFTGDWEIHELNSYLEPSKEKNTFGNYTKDDVLSVSGDFGVVNQIQFQGRSFAGASVLNYGVVHTDDIIYTKSPLKANPYGIIKTNSGMAGIVSTLYAVYRPKNGVVSKFIECYFDDDYRLNKYLHPLVNKGAKNDMKISSEKALQGEVIFPPSIEEQLTIAQTISAIEKVIMLYQRKLEKLQSMKQAMLSEMFI
jgi:type I restriction enzyme S subunit